MKLILLVSTCLLSCVFFSQAQVKTRDYFEDPALAPRDHALDFSHLTLVLSLDPDAGLVKGRATQLFTSLRPRVDSFFLDAIKMNFQLITLDGRPVKYHNDSAGVTIFPAEPLVWNREYRLEIKYEAQPRRGLYFVGWNDPTHTSRKQVWSQGEGIDNRYWIPMYDERNDKLITELIVTFDKDYKVLSNGSLKELKKNSDGTCTWDYEISHPHAPYLVMLGIGKYEIKESHSASGVPLHLYYYPEWKDRVEPTYRYSEAMMDFFEKEIGVKYPWESYSQLPVQDYMFGAMENTTATIFGDFFLVDPRGYLDRNYVGVNAHELAHQWFGDDVTARSDAHIWLQESFATYYNQMFEREVFGEDYFNWSRRGSQNAALDESTRNKLGVGHSESGGSRIYGKGAFVLNMLKYVVGGRDIYNKAIQYYLQKHPYQIVDSHDLLVDFEESTGMQLDWFWDEWIYRGGEPAYSVNYQQAGPAAEMIVSQTQELTDLTGAKKGLYRMPVVIEIHYTDGTAERMVYPINQQTEIIKFSLPAGKTTDYVLFDPGNEILKSISFPKPFSMLQAQALKAGQMLDRYDALSAMRTLPADQKRETLIKIFRQEKFFALRAEAVSQLATDNNAASLALLKAALADSNVAVRKSALKAGSPLAVGLLPDFEHLLSDSSYEIVEAALAKLADYNPAKIPAYLERTKGVRGNVGSNVWVRWLETAYNYSGKKLYGNQLVGLSSSAYEFRTRGNAMAALKRCGYYSESLLEYLVDASLSSNDRLSGPGMDLLKFLFSQDKYKKQIASYISSRSWKDWQKPLLAGFHL